MKALLLRFSVQHIEDQTLSAGSAVNMNNVIYVFGGIQDNVGRLSIFMKIGLFYLIQEFDIFCT